MSYENKWIYEGIKKISLDLFTLYLAKNDWKKVEDLKKCQLWSFEDHEFYIPNSDKYADFHLRISEMIKKLQDIENRDLIYIIDDINDSRSDILRVRVDDLFTQEGTMLIEKAGKFINETLNLIRYSASAAEQKRKYYKSQPPKIVKDYLDNNVRMGQTERGSFVIKIISNIPVVELENTQEEFKGMKKPPFQREVIKTLAIALESTKKLIDQTKDTRSEEYILRTVEKGVSANLCDALDSLTNVVSNQDVEFSFAWSPIVEELELLPRKLTFNNSNSEYLRTVSEVLKKEDSETTKRISGQVVSLHREPGEESGEITIKDNETGHKYRIELSDDVYSKAVEAHKKKSLTSCNGEIERRGNTYSLKNVEDIEIQTQSDLGFN